MSEGLKKRTQAHIPGTPEKVAEKRNEVVSDDKDVKNIVELNPDFALKVLYAKDKKSDAIQLESITHLKIILKLLYSNEFLVEVRPDANDQYLLLFVTLRDEALEQLVKLSNSSDALFGVKPNPVSDDKISIAERLRLINLKLTMSEKIGGCGLSAGKYGIKSMVPVKHVKSLEKEYKSNWGALGKVFKSSAREEDVNFLNENLGTGYALQYKFAQAYVSSIGCLGLIGIITWYFLGQFSIIFAVANLLIGFTTYFCIYASEKKTLNDWNLYNIEKAQVSIVDGDNIDPHWKILLRQIMFIPITIVGGSVLFSAQFACFLLEIFINEIYEGPLKGLFAIVPTVLVCFIVPIGTSIYSSVAQKYLAFENNSSEAAKNKSLLMKLFSFDCLASYAALSITSFIYLPLGYLADPYVQSIGAIFTKASNVYTFVPHIPTRSEKYQVNNMRLSGQMFYFMVINQIIMLVMEHGLPLALGPIFKHPKVSPLVGVPASTKVVDLKELDDPAEHEYLQLIRSKMDLSPSSLNGSYKHHVVQYGFLMLFGPVWSLGAISSFIFGVLQQELDFLKFVKFAQPPVPVRAESSAPWVGFMRTLLIIGSFTSVAVTLMYGNGIESFVGKTSVTGNWYKVVPAAIISSLTVHTAIHLFEKVVDGVYDKNNAEYINKEKKISEYFSSFKEKRATHNEDYTHELRKVDDLVVAMRK